MYFCGKCLRVRIGLGAGLCVLGLWGFGPVMAQRWNVELVSRFAPYGTRSYNDCWGYSAPNGMEIAILGLAQGVAFVNVTDPQHPTEIAFFASEPSTWRDFRTYGEYAYEVNESGGGLRIYDLTDPRFPVLVRSWEETFTTAHNIGIYDGYAYVVGTTLDGKISGTRILDLADPTDPVEVGFYTDQYVHDVFVRDDIAYMSTIQRDGLTVVDVHDKRNPRQLVYREYAGANTHNAWLSRDSSHLLTTDEVAGGHLRIWNTGDWAQVAAWTANPSASIHNVLVKGDSAYVSYYTEGFHVVDITDPTQPIPVASYDTWPGVSGGFNGAWGVYPFARSGYIYVSDISTGLYVFRLVEGGPIADFELLAPPRQAGHGGQLLFFSFDLINTSQGAASYDIVATNSHNWTTSQPARLNLAGSSSTVITVLVDVPMDVVETVDVDVEVCVTSRVTERTLCKSTEVTTPVLLQEFSARLAEGGVALDWSLDVGADDRGELVVLRAPAAVPAARIERIRLALGSRGWVDHDVHAREAYVYALGLQTHSGLAILGERHIRVTAPGRSRLLGNTPNPFNPATSIRFDLAEPGDVALRVFDARGRLVHTLLRPDLAAGRHQMLWRGGDHAGNPQPGGVYFYEIRSPRWSARGRMVLLR